MEINSADLSARPEAFFVLETPTISNSSTKDVPLNSSPLQDAPKKLLTQNNVQLKTLANSSPFSGSSKSSGNVSRPTTLARHSNSSTGSTKSQTKTIKAIIKEKEEKLNTTTSGANSKSSGIDSPPADARSSMSLASSPSHFQSADSQTKPSKPGEKHASTAPFEQLEAKKRHGKLKDDCRCNEDAATICPTKRQRRGKLKDDRSSNNEDAATAAVAAATKKCHAKSSSSSSDSPSSNKSFTASPVSN